MQHKFDLVPEKRKTFQLGTNKATLVGVEFLPTLYFGVQTEINGVNYENTLYIVEVVTWMQSATMPQNIARNSWALRGIRVELALILDKVFSRDKFSQITLYDEDDDDIYERIQRETRTDPAFSSLFPIVFNMHTSRHTDISRIHGYHPFVQVDALDSMLRSWHDAYSPIDMCKFLTAMPWLNRFIPQSLYSYLQYISNSPPALQRHSWKQRAQLLKNDTTAPHQFSAEEYTTTQLYTPLEQYYPKELVEVILNYIALY